MKRKKVVALAVAMLVLVSSCCCCFSGGDWDDWEDFDDWEDYDWDMRSLPWLLMEVSVYVVTLPLMAFAGP